MKSHRHASQLCDLQPVAPRLHATHTHITLYTRIVQIVPGLYAIVVVAISFRGKGMALLGGWTTASFGERRLAPSATFQRLFINWLECCIFCFSIIFFFFIFYFALSSAHFATVCARLGSGNIVHFPPQIEWNRAEKYQVDYCYTTDTLAKQQQRLGVAPNRQSLRRTNWMKIMEKKILRAKTPWLLHEISTYCMGNGTLPLCY